MNDIITECIWMVPYLDDFRKLYGEFQISVYNYDQKLIYEYLRSCQLKHNSSVLKLSSVNLVQNEVISNDCLTVCNPIRKRTGQIEGYILFSCNPSFDAMVLRIIVALLANQISLLKENRLSEKLSDLDCSIESAKEFAKLSVREREILNYLIQGKSDVDIVEMIGFSKSTLRAHIRKNFCKA